MHAVFLNSTNPGEVLAARYKRVPPSLPNASGSLILAEPRNGCDPPAVDTHSNYKGKVVLIDRGGTVHHYLSVDCICCFTGSET